MSNETDLAIEQILRRVIECEIPLDWKSEDPVPRVGIRNSRNRGIGIDRFEINAFEMGDDPRHINWPATARSGGQEILKNVYLEETQVNCYVLADLSDSMDFGTMRTTKRMVAAEMMASIFISIGKSRDRAGLISYTRDGVVDTITARTPSVNLYPALSSIIEADTLGAKALMSETGDGLSKALGALPRHRALVFIVSDFMNMTKKDWEDLALAAVMHDIVCIYVQDRRERELPQITGSGLFGKLFGWMGCFYTIQDHRGNRRVIWNSQSTRKQYAANFKRHESAITAALDNNSCQWMIVSTEEGDAAIPKILSIFDNHC